MRGKILGRATKRGEMMKIEDAVPLNSKLYVYYIDKYGTTSLLFHRYQISVIKFYMYQWCWNTQYKNECREVSVIKFVVMQQCVLRNWIIMLHKKSFWIVPVPLVLHCGLTPLIGGIFKGPSIDSELQWGYRAVQQVKLQQALSPKRKKISSISFLHSSYYTKRFLLKNRVN